MYPILSIHPICLSSLYNTFYQKSMYSPVVNMYRSDVSAKTKRDSLLMEGIRRLRNISTGVSETERRNILGRFMNTLRLSVYNSKYRSELLRGILKRDREIQTEIDSGKRVRHRSRQQMGVHTWACREGREKKGFCQGVLGGYKGNLSESHLYIQEWIIYTTKDIMSWC